MATTAIEAQQWGPITLLSSYKLFSTPVNNTNVILFNDQFDAQFFFLYMFISILYIFRAFKCSSSGDSVVSIRYQEYVTLCR
jgi:hypothetical protein